MSDTGQAPAREKPEAPRRRRRTLIATLLSVSVLLFVAAAAVGTATEAAIGWAKLGAIAGALTGLAAFGLMLKEFMRRGRVRTVALNGYEGADGRPLQRGVRGNAAVLPPEPPAGSQSLGFGASLLPCRGCAHPVAVDARACPNCGTPRPAGVLARSGPRFTRAGSTAFLIASGVTLVVVLVGALVASRLRSSASMDADVKRFQLSSIYQNEEALGHPPPPSGEVLICETAPDGSTCQADQASLDDDQQKMNNYKVLEDLGLLLAAAATLLLIYGAFVRRTVRN